jgi:hypothetical protein
METKAKAIKSDEPHYFQTVLACTILDKTVNSLLPSFANVLKPVCNYIFRSVFKGFPRLENLETDKSGKNNISSYPFLYYKAFSDMES